MFRQRFLTFVLSIFLGSMMVFAPVELVLGMAINLHSADEKIWGLQFGDVQILFNM